MTPKPFLGKLADDPIVLVPQTNDDAVVVV
jgi:hypothetical protein